MKGKCIRREEYLRKTWIWVDPISVVGGSAPWDQILLLFRVLLCLSQACLSQGYFQLRPSFPASFPSPGSAGEISLHNREHGKEQTYLCSVCPFCIFVVTSQRQENWPATPCGSSFPYLSCCSAQACSGGAECCGQVDEMIP